MGTYREITKDMKHESVASKCSIRLYVMGADVRTKSRKLPHF